MPVLQFGTGLLYGTPNAGNLAVNPTPIRLLLQEVSIDFKADLKKLWTQGQFPIAKARAKVEVSGKAKIVNFDPDPMNQLFFAQAVAAGMIVPIDREIAPVSGTTITVLKSANFEQDNGVQYTNGSSAGATLIKVASAPAQGEYSVNATTGVYTFNVADNNIGMAISYTYTNTSRGKTITLNNQLMGYAPEIAMDVWNNFRNKVLGIRLYSCVVGSWTFPSKLDDFWISDIAFDASTDASDSLGKIFADYIG